MKKNTLLRLVISIIFIPFLLNAQTEISGGINENTTWTLENSPYIITGDTVIFGDNTLTIEAGVTVKFDDDVQLRIQGPLIAIGNENENIIFTSNSINPQRGSWKEIKLESNLICTLDYVIIEYADIALNYPRLDTSSSIKNSIIRSNNYGIKTSSSIQFPITITSVKFIDNDKGISDFHEELNLINCEFKNNRIGAELVESNIDMCLFEGNTGIALDGHTTIVQNSTFIENNIALDQSFSGGSSTYPTIITGNTIKNNNIGLIINGNFNSNSSCTYNIICNNTTYNIQHNTSASGHNLSNNCWCTEDIDEIENSIFHGLDDINYGIVIYDPIETDCIDVTLSLNSFPLSKNENQFYPNPVENLIKFNNNSEKQFEIYTIHGKPIKAGLVKNNLDLSSLNKGIYLIKITESNNFTIEKLIKN